jgi:beta-glucosidase
MTKNETKVVLLLLSVLLSMAAVAQAPPNADIQNRVESILSKMTLEEKIDYIGGKDDFYIRAIPRLGVPELKMADGPMGVRNYGPSTAFPAGIAMAASWDTDLVNRVGTMMGKDARARGVHFLLGPGMNIYRAPMSGRNFEYFGEDPFLASRMAVADIKGIQSQGVIATAKHFMGNNQEWDRHRISSDMDERTMREIYLPAFEASVREAHVGAIMDSYNFVNGVHMTQNGYLNTGVLRKEWGFTGIVMSDWDATYDAVAAANGGLDLEMPWAKLMNRKSLPPAVKDGKVAEAIIDEKVRRILRTAIEFGFFDRRQNDLTISSFNQEARKVALQAALGGMVLLKNNGLLPLKASAVKNIAVIGPTANPAVTGGGGSSKVAPFLSVSFLEGISNYLSAGANVLYSAGVPAVSQIFSETRFATGLDGLEPGLVGEYFDSPDLTGTPSMVRTSRHINFRWGQGSYTSGGADYFSARWSGYYTPETTGEYRVYLSSEDGYRLYLDDKLVIEHQPDEGAPQPKSILLESGKAYKVRLEYSKKTRRAGMAFGIAPAADREIVRAKEIASRADVVVLCAGFDQTNEGEGSDRSFALPQGQDELIKQILSVNKNVVVVLTAGGNADMSSWIDSTPALLHTWYPGQEGGTALAQILFGDVNPSGKLPVSFERRREDSATYNSYYDPKLGASSSGDRRDPSGTARGHVVYSEGIFLGYRHFDKTGIKPLFPFGYGLSYTTFKYSNLKVTPASAKDGDPVAVSFAITNTGEREGAEVAQVYVSDKHAKVERPVKELKAFAKVNLKPGETRSVTVSLDRRAFSYYDVNGKQWKADPGDFAILVGASSAATELAGKVTLVPPPAN